MDLDRLCSLLQDMEVEGWWPSDGPFEVMVGALLTPQTTWEKVVLVLETMRREGLMDPLSLSQCPVGRLQELVRPTGFFRQKSQRLQALSRHIVKEHDGDPREMLQGDLRERRRELLSLPGIGPETADSILLFAGGRPKFVAAIYVIRVLHRTGVLSDGDYDSAQCLVESKFPDDTGLYRRLYASLVEVAKAHCRNVPRCEGCPLRPECRFTHR
jgi:endonuclease-3 related protein